MAGLGGQVRVGASPERSAKGEEVEVNGVESPLTSAGKAIVVQLVALVAATNECPVGVEAALLARGPHLTLVHICGEGERG